MRIGINLLFLIPNKVGGTEYYARSLLSELEKQDKINTYIVFCNKESETSLQFTSPKWKKVVCDVNAENRVSRILFEQFLLPILSLHEKCDLLHSLGYTSPIFSHCPLVTTIHDANWNDMPQDSNLLERIALHLLVTSSAKSAKNIVTDSKFAFNRIQLAFPKLKDKIIIIQPGLDPSFLSLLKSTKRLSEKKYLLCVSGFYPHKNIPYLLELWKKLSKFLPNYKLILVGRNGRDEQKVLSLAQNMHSVILFQKVSIEKLAELYKSAGAFLFPSIYEGFGFPVYEALAAEIPIFVGSKKPFQEIIDHLYELSFNIDTDAELISKKIHDQPKKIPALPSYAKTAKKMINLYQDCLS